MKGFERKMVIGCMFLMVLLTIVGSFLIFDSRQKKANEEMRMQLHQLQLQYSPLQRDTVRDSIKLITQQVMVMDRGEYKLLAADRELLSQISECPWSLLIQSRQPDIILFSHIVMHGCHCVLIRQTPS